MSKMNAGLLVARRVAPLPCQNTSQLAQLLLHLSFFGKSIGFILATSLQQLVLSLLSSGRSMVQFFVDIRRMIWRSVGWMSASPRSPVLRDLGLRFTIPRWKILSGKCFALDPSNAVIMSAAWTMFATRDCKASVRLTVHTIITIVVEQDEIVKTRNCRLPTQQSVRDPTRCERF